MSDMRQSLTANRRRRTVLQVLGAASLVSIGVVGTAKPKERVIKVVAKKFDFVPGEIRIAKGETVVFQLTAPEVPMGFNLPDFNARIAVVPGKVATLRFTPDKTGTYTFLCDVFCGSGHEDMNGTLIVT